MSNLSRFQARFLALGVTVLWSSSWVLIRIGFDDTDLRPLTFAGLRYGLAAMVLAGVLGARRHRRPRTEGDRGHVGMRSWLAPLMLLGVIQYAATQGSQFIAIENQPAATTSLMLSMTPMLVAFGGVFVGEPPRGRHFVGAALAVVGATIYFTGELGATRIGMIAAIVTVLSNATSALIGRSINRQRQSSAGTITLVSMSTGAAVLLASGLVVEGLPRLDATAAAILAWLAVVNTAAAFTWWNMALRELPAFDVATIQNTMGIQVPLLGWLFLNQSLGSSEILGITCAAVGAWVAVTATSLRHDRSERVRGSST